MELGIPDNNNFDNTKMRPVLALGWSLVRGLRSRRFELLLTYRVPTIDILNIDFENLSPIILIEGLLNKTEY